MSTEQAENLDTILRQSALPADTDSSAAICGRDRLVGRYRSTRSSPGLSSAAGSAGC